MSKELIERLRGAQKQTDVFMDDLDEAADLIEAQQKRIELYEQALKASWPEGAIGDAFDYWNAARMDGI